MAHTPLRREAIARMICSAWQHLNTAEASTRADEFLFTLLEKNSVEIVGTLKLPAFGLPGEKLECHALIKGLLTWDWTDKSIDDAQSKCNSLHMNLEKAYTLQLYIEIV